jgi:hypothetical protein
MKLDSVILSASIIVILIILINVMRDDIIYYMKNFSDRLSYTVNNLKDLESDGNCASSGELESKKVVTALTGKRFHKVRPAFLTNPHTGKRLELDLYNEEMKLAVEFNGRQHYEYVPHFHKSFNDFVNQIARDRIKEDLCKAHGVKLISVPYNVDIYKHISSELRRLGVIA